METQHKLNSPKSFFMWLGIMTSLYVSTFGIVILLFELIDRAFPETLDTFVDPSAGAIRGAIAVLIVAFPLYVYLTRKANQGIRKNPEEREHPFRKWLIYLTLFASGATLSIDLVVVINAFLGGELTSRFLFKAIVIFIIVGLLFYYYISDLKNKWQNNESLSKKIGALAGFLVLVSIVLGFVVVGSPNKQRLLKIDNERISDLSSITWEIDDYYFQNEKLPETLDMVRDDSFANEVFVDPETGDQYEYNIVGPKMYELCANFNLENQDTRKRFHNENWDHGIGRTCFEGAVNEKALEAKRIPAGI